MKAILVLNAGSSSLKFAVFPTEPTLANAAALSGQIEGIGAEPTLSARDNNGHRHRETLAISSNNQAEQHQDALQHLFRWLKQNARELDIVAAGHRIVHGGEAYSAPVLIDETVLNKLHEFEVLAPLHQPHNLRAVHAVAKLNPSIRQIGCFDTAFHRTQPAVAQAFALPRALSAEGVKRYGFHGLSYDYVSRQLPEVLGKRAEGGVIIAHLGNGASLCALRNGKCVSTTMGFTAIDGLMMGTRTGNIDPGVLLYLMERKGMGLKELTDVLYKESGLLGVSGISQDMRTLEASDRPEAAEAIELFCYRIARELGSHAAASQGLDALVFTGGIGENSPIVRKRVAELAAWMGIKIDLASNEAGSRRIDSSDSSVAVAVVPTNEEAMIARYTATTLGL